MQNMKDRQNCLMLYCNLKEIDWGTACEWYNGNETLTDPGAVKFVDAVLHFLNEFNNVVCGDNLLITFQNVLYEIAAASTNPLEKHLYNSIAESSAKGPAGFVTFRFKGKPCILALNAIQGLTNTGLGKFNTGNCVSVFENVVKKYYYIKFILSNMKTLSRWKYAIR